MIDCLCFGACVLDEIEHTSFMQVGGDAANQTIILKKLGLNPVLCALVGIDKSADKIIHYLKSIGLNTKYIIQKEEVETTHSRIHLDKNKERTFTVSGGAHRLLKKEDFPYHLLSKTKALSLGSLFTMHELEENGMLEILAEAKQRNCIIFSDTTTDRHHKGLIGINRFLPYFDYFMPSYDEACKLTGKNNPDEIADLLINQGCQCVVLKQSSLGASLYRKNTKITCQAFEAEVVDTTGAGDNFCAGFIASILSGLDEKEALVNACWMGARAVESLGANSTKISKLPYPIKTSN